MQVPENILQQFNLEVIKPELKKRYDYNCLGFTRYIFEQNKLYWEKSFIMENWLKTHTKKVKKSKIGDIGVMEDSYGLTHTFIVIDPTNNMILHKPGVLPLTVETINEGIINGNMRGYGKITEFRRFKKEVKDNENY